MFCVDLRSIKYDENNDRIYVMFCAIWYHLYNLKNVKNTHGGVLLLIKLQALSHIRKTCFRNAVHSSGINQKRHILVNLGQIEDETPLASMEI